MTTTELGKSPDGSADKTRRSFIWKLGAGRVRGCSVHGCPGQGGECDHG